MLVRELDKQMNNKKKIIGVLPVGGNAVRLGLPASLSKPMLPQARKDKYIPVICHSIEKMKKAGATEIYLIHAKGEYRNDIVEYFNESGYHHLQQRKDNFANSLLTSISFYYDGQEDGTTRILFGLPDTVYNDNPYLDLVEDNGVSIALFKADDELKVDRLRTGSWAVDESGFDVKSSKKDNNSQFFWGCFALDSQDLTDMINNNKIRNLSEIGEVLNRVDGKKYYYYNNYLDLGIWSNMNKYWSENKL